MSLERRTSGQEFASPAGLRPELVIPPEVEAERPIMAAFAFEGSVLAATCDVRSLIGLASDSRSIVLLSDQHTRVLRGMNAPLTRAEFEELARDGLATMLAEPTQVTARDAAMYTTAAFITAFEQDTGQTWQLPDAVRTTPTANDSTTKVAVGPLAVLDAQLRTAATSYLDASARLVMQTVSHPEKSGEILRRMYDAGWRGLALVHPNDPATLEHCFYLGLSVHLQGNNEEWLGLLEIFTKYLDSQDITRVKTRVEQMATVLSAVE